MENAATYSLGGIELGTSDEKAHGACYRNRRIFVYTFCLINICLSLSDDANKIKTLNIERA